MTAPDCLAMAREAVAHLLHPESPWFYLWTDEDTHNLSGTLDLWCGYKPGAGLWWLDQMALGRPLAKVYVLHFTGSISRDYPVLSATSRGRGTLHTGHAIMVSDARGEPRKEYPVSVHDVIRLCPRSVTLKTHAAAIEKARVYTIKKNQREWYEREARRLDMRATP